MIYLACPYSHPDPFVRKWRYLQATRQLTELLLRGQWAYSPIVHCHELAKTAGLPRDAAFWSAYNLYMLQKADFLMILTLPGWQESAGVREEIEFAAKHHKAQLYVEPLDAPED